jgi:hypothetical protein
VLVDFLAGSDSSNEGVAMNLVHRVIHVVCSLVFSVSPAPKNPFAEQDC